MRFSALIIHFLLPALLAGHLHVAAAEVCAKGLADIIAQPGAAKFPGSVAVVRKKMGLPM
jgi:hypothetical protein